jgi:hypothetical protein
LHAQNFCIPNVLIFTSLSKVLKTQAVPALPESDRLHKDHEHAICCTEAQLSKNITAHS